MDEYEAMYMKKNKRIIVTVLLIVLLSAVIAAAGKECYDFERRACFSRLTGYTEEIGSDIKRTLESAFLSGGTVKGCAYF